LIALGSAAALSSSILLFACGDDEDDVARSSPRADAATPDDAVDPGTDGSTAPDSGEGGSAPLAIRFKAADGDGKEWKCGGSNLRVGNLNDVRPGDLRFYVHEVGLIAMDGATIPFTLVDDGKWQHQGVALLDFEDASAECAFVIFGKSKSADMNTELRGTPGSVGPYRGVRFKLGVPASLNHTDVGLAPSPLSVTGMDHGPADGRQFLRASFYSDTTGASGNNDHNLIMLRTVCNNVTADGGAPPADEDACTKPNRPLITVERDGGFDPAKHEVIVDVTNLFAGCSPLGTAGPADLNDSGRIDCFGPLHAGDLGPTLGAERCGKFYPNLGLAYDTGRAAGTQTVFRAP